MPTRPGFQNLIKRSISNVYISLNNSVYWNLAFEDWIYCGLDKQSQFPPTLFVYRNKDAVVIGRHQNPWLECDARRVETVARRRSGGGAVFHDLGNVNFTFFTPRRDYNRAVNLKLVCSVLERLYPDCGFSINCRDDIMLSSAKISGSAAKLGRNCAFHHFTLLCNSDLTKMSALRSPIAGNIETNATRSAPAKVTNIAAHTQLANTEDIVFATVQTFAENLQNSPRICYVDPANCAQTKEISVSYAELSDWHWIFGWTPRFKYNLTFNNRPIQLNVERGLLIGCTNSGSPLSDQSALFGRNVIGCRFDEFLKLVSE